MADTTLTTHLTARDSTSSALTSVGSAAAAAAGGLASTASSAGSASSAVTSAGDASTAAADDMRRLRQEADLLDGQIGTLQTSLRSLAREYARTGDATTATRIREAQRDLRDRENARRLLGAITPDDGSTAAAATATGVRWATRFTSAAASTIHRSGAALHGALGGAFESMPPQAQIAITSGVVAAVGVAAPLIGGVVAGAVVGAAGVGGVVGGIAIAARHPAVKAAAQETGDTIMSVLQESAVSFVPATVKGLHIIRSETKSMAGDFEEVFSGASRYVEPFSRGVTGFAREVMPGLKAAIRDGGPVVDELASWGPKLGRLVGDMFGDFADNAAEGARALAMLWSVVDGGVRMVVSQLATLATVYGWMDKISALATGNTARLAALTAAERGVGDGAKDGAAGLQELIDGFLDTEDAAEGATEEVESLNAMIKRLTSDNLSAREAQRGLEEAIDAATAAARENGKTLDINTSKGRANQGALDAIARSAWDAHDAIMIQTQSQESANAALERGRTAFLATARSMGVAEAEAQALANQLFGIKSKSVKVTLDAQRAISDARLATQALLSIKNRTVWVSVKYSGIRDIQTQMDVRLGRRAWGGRIDGVGPKGVDSVPILAAPGEHMLSAREVDGLGGHQAVERIRAIARGDRPAVESTTVNRGGGGGGWGVRGGRASWPSGGGGGHAEDELYRAVARALREMPVMRVDSARQADLYARTGG